MAENALAKKLLIKPGMSIRLLEAPPGFVDSLSPLSEGAETDESAATADFVLLFAGSKGALDASSANAVASLRDGGVFWWRFPKEAPKCRLTCRATAAGTRSMPPAGNLSR